MSEDRPPEAMHQEPSSAEAVPAGPDFFRLAEQLAHAFREPGLLRTALTHRSYANEHRELSPGGSGVEHNDRLEFLGDAVLGLSIGHLLMRLHPEVSEGELSRLRAAVVSEPSLAEVARGLGLGAYLLLGRGEEQGGGRQKPSLLADAMEAVLGAVYLDASFEAAQGLVERLFGGSLTAGVPAHADHKTDLQERCQRQLGRPPVYQILSTSGPDHAKVFLVQVSVDGRVLGEGEGRSKKLAEQQAARQALTTLSGAEPARAGVEREAETGGDPGDLPAS